MMKNITQNIESWWKTIIIDLTGKEFGRLKVLKIDSNRNDIEKQRVKNGEIKKSEIYWICECACSKHTIVTVSGHSLKSKNTQSCGCYMKEKILMSNKFHKKKYNEYNLSGEYGIGYTSKGEEFYFDLEDYDLIKDYCWFINSHGYVSAKCNGNALLMHRIINEHTIVDHINHNKYDNRKSNLRNVSKSKNAMNHKLLINNTSGITGVYWNKSKNAWESIIIENNNRIYLGSFNKKEDAIKARKNAEEKYFGEYSYDNSIKEK